MKVGIVGNGFVGSAVAFGFSAQTGCNAEVMIYDVDKTKSQNTLSDVLNQSDYVFVSVPTPANPNGTINLDIVYEVFEEISILNKNDNVILLRSTVLPGTSRKLSETYKNLNIVFNPEFLTERSAKHDFINQARFILGGSKELTNKTATLYRWRFGETVPIIQTDYETSELIKYMNNCFFATKVSFLNEMYQVSSELGADWNIAIEGFVRDGRVGHSHLEVPGPDGSFGFGGSCFPKDIQAMIAFSKSLNINPDVLSGVWKKNLEVRPSQDWKKLEGRAVLKKTK